MAKGEVKLLGSWPSPYVMRARIALNLKSVEYEFLEEKLGVKSELLLKSNPVHKKIPVLLHHSKPICESLVIVQYIDEVWSSGPAILPSDPYDRAVARFWASYVDEKFFPALRALPMAQGKEAMEAAMHPVKEGLALLEDAYANHSKGGPFFGGGQISYLDVAFGCFLGVIRVSEKVTGVALINEHTTPGLAGWAEEFCAHPAVEDVMPDTDKLTEFINRIIKMKSQSPN
ncbi:hypothetical protein Nepgr_017179 [Nepenthes gracilis]|uniref:Glutathione S-transferase n=1 Tax=Nepenthes gracilis TaxID=150966 RepID=A0AAD3SPY7_NEPGR|nr:hypothetical protein Nepgr_017179 [Nepenthes gracilis]